MKIRLFLFVMSLAFVSGLALISCKDDDVDGSLKGNKIIGTWCMQLDNKNGNPFYDNKPDGFYMQFQEDGTLIMVNDAYHGDILLVFTTFNLSGNNVVIKRNESNATIKAEYGFSDNVLHLTTNDGNYSSSFALTRMGNNVLDSYFIKYNQKSYLNENEVDLNLFKVDLDQYLANIDQYKVNLEHYITTLNPTTTIDGLSCPDENHPHAIDMGTEGFWACCNVGASNPMDYGGFYAWGETEEKDKYGESDYKYYDKTKGYELISNDIAGYSFDVAKAKWGEKWIMPSNARFTSLIKNCTTKAVRLYENDNIDNCYYINGKTCKIENPSGFYFVNDIIYDFSNTDLNDYYVIDNKIYKIDHIDDFFVLNNKVYKFDNEHSYYCINGKTYKIKNIGDLYIKGSDLYYITPRAIVVGIKNWALSQNFQHFYKLNANQINYYRMKLNDMRIINKLCGRLFTAPNGNSIFLPAAGIKYNDSFLYDGECGYYWSSTLTPNNSSNAYCLYFYFNDIFEFEEDGYFYDNGYFCKIDSRFSGMSVRPVIK